ncbi:hypothetical protein [Mitsuokella jalaludinii]
MEDIHLRVAVSELKSELAKELKPCPFCGKELARWAIEKGLTRVMV